MELNDLLQGKGIEPREVLVLRHRPSEPDLNKVLPLLASDKPDLFNAYQQTHGEKLEKAMLGASYVASFVRHEGRRALYVGLYKIGKTKRLTHANYWKVPAHIELRKLGMRGLQTGKRASCLWFDLKLMNFYSEWKGKLIVDWPPPERAWWRRHAGHSDYRGASGAAPVARPRPTGADAVIAGMGRLAHQRAANRSPTGSNDRQMAFDDHPSGRFDFKDGGT